MKRVIKKNNKEQIEKINQLCSETRRFIEVIEDGLLNSNTTDSEIYQFIESLKKETDVICQRYSAFFSECTGNLMNTASNIVEQASFYTEDIKKRLMEYTHSFLSPAPKRNYMPSATLFASINSPGYLF